MAVNERPSHFVPLCPRCGYDQSGAIATWNASCPLTGLCPECGLKFDWLDVMVPERHDLPWFFEHGRGVAALRAVRTWLGALLPWLFWSSVSLAARTSPRRQLLWLLLVFGGLHVTTSLVRTWNVYEATLRVGVRMRGVPSGWYTSHYLTAWLHPFAVLGFDGSAYLIDFGPRHWPWAALLAIAPIPLMPIMLLLLGNSRAVTKVRGAHILRAAVLQCSVFLLWYIVLLAEAVEIAVSRSMWTNSTGWTTEFIWKYTTVIAIGAATWFAAWWYFAIVRGFRLPQGRLIWGLLMLACVLLGLIAATLDHRFGLLLW